MDLQKEWIQGNKIICPLSPKILCTICSSGLELLDNVVHSQQDYKHKLFLLSQWNMKSYKSTGHVFQTSETKEWQEKRISIQTTITLAFRKWEDTIGRNLKDKNKNKSFNNRKLLSGLNKPLKDSNRLNLISHQDGVQSGIRFCAFNEHGTITSFKQNPLNDPSTHNQ